MAMQQACSSVLPSCRLRGCLFHWSQAVWRKVQEVGLRSEYICDPTFNRIIRHLFGLPFLPASEITSTFWHLYLTAFTGKLLRLFDYMHDTWIQGDKWEPCDWSVYHEDVRTNNHVEGWHHRLNSKALRSTLPFYALVKMLYEEGKEPLLRSTKALQRRANIPSIKRKNMSK